jgi:hypothetical protein
MGLNANLFFPVVSSSRQHWTEKDLKVKLQLLEFTLSHYSDG